MEFGHELRRLRAEHAELRELASILMAGCDARLPRAGIKTGPVWQQYYVLLTRHLKCEDWVLYPRIAASMSAEVVKLAEEIAAEFGDLGDRLADYHQRWSEAAMTSDWTACAPEMEALLDHAESRAEREENLLFPAAALDYAKHRRAG